MKIMFIVYHDINSEARSKEIYQVCNRIGDAYLITYRQPHNVNKNIYVSGNGKRRYFPFIFKAVKMLRIIKPDMVVLHDNYTSPLIPFIKLFYGSYIVYDSSELFIKSNIRRNKGKRIKSFLALLFNYFEKKYLKKADLVLAANIERAKIMKDYFRLNSIPFVFDNIHKIEEKYNIEYCIKNYKRFFVNNKFNILYAGGVRKDRETYTLADTFKRLGKGYFLIIVGSATQLESSEFKDYLKNNTIENVIYLGFVSRNNLKYLIENSAASISAFKMDTYNNIFCASGKIYESIFLNRPIIVTENPPLKRLCAEKKVGISSNDFYFSIKKLHLNYDYYYKNVVKYHQELENAYNSRLKNLASLLIDKYKNKINGDYKHD
ncbi:hypothetical protein ACAG96_00680 [Candidatus Izemoplasma sp. B36]|uniref:hypothetical protein n=1 Tax=Candidatus Izemoplasma sp. B36 TaxID=3242468 RepID=UPI003557F612